ncbi:eukaryotic translation initiation factor 2D isoform X2 [Ammospiza caudacuta]|uniref:eukaryotic translation initiation factor 2D isoform X2 n=1 Tax=Ammospiza caudacuta TaxID=2857398 RepID=UPI002738B735|nr:eukaryotic translation initiation factor 2D isoform X2 [Ammospiza caudacuta]
MFARAFRVRANTSIKGSDRRKLRSDVAAAFPSLSTEQVAELVPSKEELNVIKIYSHKGEAITVYMNHRNPILFEVEKVLYPTVYTLWVYPDLLPAFTTWPPVLQKLAGGADLMLPGVVVPPSGLPQVTRGTLCAVTLQGNREYGDKSSPPTLAPLGTDCAAVESAGDQEELQGKEPGSSCSPEPEQHVDIRDLSLRDRDTCAELLGQEELHENRAAEPAEDASTQDQQEAEDSRTPQEQMDALFNQCFFHALKCRVKKSDLPLLTSTFLGSHMVSCCPAGKQLDIKKSSYKKFSKFLQCMQHQRILQVKELSKGVESIVDVDWKHPDIKAFAVPEGFSSASAAQDSKSEEREQVYHAPEIIPLYGVSTKMIPLFQESGHRKGSILSSSEVRNIIINYVKSNELVDETNKNFVKVNAILCDCLLDKSEQDEISHLKWDELLSRCLERLQPLHQVTFSGQEPVVRKGNIEPIDISIAQRSSNKKVTIIKNLELYGLDPQCVANTLQQKVQASATISPAPGTKDRVQVQIQGNQIHHLAKMLLEEYQLPRKYIQGLDKAPKLGRKK